MRIRIVMLFCTLMSMQGTSLVAQTSFDANATPDFFAGTGNDNGSFTVNRQNGVELALRGKLRFNESDGNRAANIFHSNGDGSYSFQARNVSGESGLPWWWTFPQTPEWSFDFSINSDTDSDARTLGALTYELGLDSDPTLGTNFFKFDPINAGAADHFFGTNQTTDGTDEVKGNSSDSDGYNYLLANKTVAQQSWNYAFFLAGLSNFQAESIGVYDIYLKAFDNGTEVASVSIQILVGAEQFEGEDPQTLVETSTADLTDYTYEVNVSKGIDNSLDKKLENAFEAYVEGVCGTRQDVIDRLDAYINHVEAQRGKKLTDGDADSLRSGAEYIQILVRIL